MGIDSNPYEIELKEAIQANLVAGAYDCVDLGSSLEHPRPYYGIAHELASKIGAGEIERGIAPCLGPCRLRFSQVGDKRLPQK